MREKGFTLLIFLPIILFSLVVVYGVYWYTGSIIRSTPQPSLAPTPQPSDIYGGPFATPFPVAGTENWKTYSDRYAGIAFKYPPEATASLSLEKPHGIVNNDKIPPYFLLTINLDGAVEGQTPRQVLENEIQVLRNNQNMPLEAAKSIADFRESTITAYKNGVVDGAFMRLGRDEDTVNSGIQVVFIHNYIIYSFTIHNGSGEIDPYHKELLDKILSTLQFMR